MHYYCVQWNDIPSYDFILSNMILYRVLENNVGSYQLILRSINLCCVRSNNLGYYKLNWAKWSFSVCFDLILSYDFIYHNISLYYVLWMIIVSYDFMISYASKLRLLISYCAVWVYILPYDSYRYGVMTLRLAQYEFILSFVKKCCVL